MCVITIVIDDKSFARFKFPVEAANDGDGILVHIWSTIRDAHSILDITSKFGRGDYAQLTCSTIQMISAADPHVITYLYRIRIAHDVKCGWMESYIMCDW